MGEMETFAYQNTFANWVCRTCYLGLSHSNSSTGHLTTGLPAKKKKRLWVYEPRVNGTEHVEESRAKFTSWQPGHNSSQFPYGVLEGHIFSGWISDNKWIFDNKLNLGSSQV